jgi:hydrogenase expression/formation protein HypC
MRIVEARELSALATTDGTMREVSTLLLDRAVVPGDWVLVHTDTAVRTMTEDEAALVSDALRAVLAASDGHDFDHLIADLIDREPQLPAHLRPQTASS